MKLKRRSKATLLENDEGASTSSEVQSRSNESPATEKEPYRFPSNLVKERRWKEHVLAPKVYTEAASLIDVTTIFDFFNKLSGAFNLTAITEQQLDVAIMSEESSGAGLVLIKMIVELFNGLSSIDFSHFIRMHVRNRTYHETTSQNYNQSFWVFLDHDWKLLSPERQVVKNVLGSCKEKANFFSLPTALRSALLLDLCMYRLMCPDAQDVIDSVIDEGMSVSSQLRTEPIGCVDGADFYYFGGIRVYRFRLLTKKELKAQKRREKSAHFVVTPQKTIETGTEKKDSSIPVGVPAKNETQAENDTATKKSELTTDQVDPSTVKQDEQCSSEIKNEACTDKEDAVDESASLANGISDVDDLDSLANQEYFLALCDKDFKWEVVCCGEDDIHYLIEFCASNHSSGSQGLREALINMVLPAVQNHLRLQKEREKRALRASRFMPKVYDPVQFIDGEARHSRRLEMKKVEREKQLEEQRRQELEMENMIREQEGKRKLHITEIETYVQPKMSREERLRLREQRILELEAEKRKSLDKQLTETAEITRNSNTGTDVESIKPAAPSSVSEVVSTASIVSDCHVSEAQNGFNKPDAVKTHRRKQSFDFCEKMPSVSGQLNEISSSSKVDESDWKTVVLPGEMRRNGRKRRSFEDRTFIENVEHSQLYGKKNFSDVHGARGTCDTHGFFNRPSSARNQDTILPGRTETSLPESVSHRNGLLPLTGSSDLSHQNHSNDSRDFEVRRPEDVNLNESNQTSHFLSENRQPISENFGMKHNELNASSSNVYSDGNIPSTNGTANTNEQQDSEDDEGLGKIIVKKYLDYPSINSAECFRIIVPDGSYLTLKASGPLQDHDYIVPSVELIIDQKWKFSAEPINPHSSFQPLEFNLQKQEPLLPPEELLDVET